MNKNPKTYNVPAGQFQVLLLGRSLVIDDSLPREDWRHEILQQGGTHTSAAKALGEVDARRAVDGPGYDWQAIGDEDELAAVIEAGLDGDFVYDALLAIGLTATEADRVIA